MCSVRNCQLIAGSPRTTIAPTIPNSSTQPMAAHPHIVTKKTLSNVLRI
jgi:hypothetical protein